MFGRERVREREREREREGTWAGAGGWLDASGFIVERVGLSLKKTLVI